MKKDFVYFVEDTDTSFVLNDLRQIAKVYDRILLFSAEEIDNKDELPGNTVVFDQFIDWQRLDLKRVLLSNLFSILSIYFSECLALKKILPIKASIALLCSNFYKAEQCKKALLQVKDFNTSSPFYAFWFYDCIYLARLVQLGMAKKAYIRSHGGDLFEERSSLFGKVLFRHYQFRHVNKVFSVSETGTGYLANKYPKFSNKISTLYLGSFPHNDINPFQKTPFTFVSCAKIRDIKRIHLIAEALQFVDFPCTWYHLGDENLQAKNDEGIPLYLNAKAALTKAPHINFVVKGSLSNEEVYNFYRHTPVNLFISVSASEGIPVSMMEAISFGIPIISTNVGGCHEIVKETSGELIAADPSPEAIAQSIISFAKSEKNSINYRTGVKQFWNNKFDADKNYSQFFTIVNSK